MLADLRAERAQHDASAPRPSGTACARAQCTRSTGATRQAALSLALGAPAFECHLNVLLVAATHAVFGSAHVSEHVARRGLLLPREAVVGPKAQRRLDSAAP